MRNAMFPLICYKPHPAEWLVDTFHKAFWYIPCGLDTMGPLNFQGWEIKGWSLLISGVVTDKGSHKKNTILKWGRGCYNHCQMGGGVVQLTTVRWGGVVKLTTVRWRGGVVKLTTVRWGKRLYNSPLSDGEGLKNSPLSDGGGVLKLTTVRWRGGVVELTTVRWGRGCKAHHCQMAGGVVILTIVRWGRGCKTHHCQMGRGGKTHHCQMGGGVVKLTTVRWGGL